MKLEQTWKKYEKFDFFNKDVLPCTLVSKGTLVTFRAGSTVIYAGDPPEHVYFICSGVVQGKRQYNDGNDYHYFTLNPRNGSVGLLEIFARKNEAIATITAQTDVTALKIPSDVLYDYIMNDVESLRRCLHIVSFDLYKRSGNDGLLYYLNGIDRVKYFLTEYYKDYAASEEDTVALNVTYTMIANHIGVSSRTVGRSMKELKAVGLISCHKKKFYISSAQHQTLLRDLHI